MGDRGESPPLKADKYLCERGNREQGSWQQSRAQINTFSLRLLRVSISPVSHVLGLCFTSTIKLHFFVYFKNMFSKQSIYTLQVQIIILLLSYNNNVDFVVNQHCIQ